MRWPSSVKWDRLRSRRKSSPPKSASSCLIARVNEGCATLQRSAARVKFSSRATARKYRTWCISIWISPNFEMLDTPSGEQQSPDSQKVSKLNSKDISVPEASPLPLHANDVASEQ